MLTTPERRADRANDESGGANPISAAMRRVLIPALLAMVVLLGSGPAFAVVKTVRWTHADLSTVTGFRIVSGPASRDYDTSIDVGIPSLLGGEFSAAVDLPDGRDNYVAVVAYNEFGDSSPSNESLVVTEPTDGGDPDPTPSPTSPSEEPDPDLIDEPTVFTPVADPLLLTHFGTPVAPEWYDTGADNSLARDDSLFGILGVDGTNAFGTTSEAVNIHSHFVSTESAGWSDYEYRGRMMIGSDGAGIGVTTYSAYPDRDAYYRLRSEGNGGQGDFHLSAHPDGGIDLDCSSQSTGVTPVAGTWYAFRIQTTTESLATAIRAKVWPADGGEPTTWQAVCRDYGSQRAASGAPGVWSMGSGFKAWDDLEVFSTSDTPPPPEPLEPPLLLDVVPVNP